MANNDVEIRVNGPRRPTSEQLRRELARMKKKRGLPIALRIILFLLVIAIIGAITFYFLQAGYVIYGSSMLPTLEEKDFVLIIPKAEFHSGDMVAFQHEERILIKRVIAGPGDTISVLPDGQVKLNGEDLYESYTLISEPSISDMNYPLEVPEGSWFVLGDNRGSSVDSRSSILGLIDNEQILGKVCVRVWPLNRLCLFDPNFFSELLKACNPF